MSIYRRVIAYYRPFWKPTALAAALTLASTAFGILRVWPLKFLINLLSFDRTSGHALTYFGYDLTAWPTQSVVLLLCGLMVGFHLLGGLANYVTTMIFVRVGLQALLRLRTDLYAYLHSAPAQVS